MGTIFLTFEQLSVDLKTLNERKLLSTCQSPCLFPILLSNWISLALYLIGFSVHENFLLVIHHS